MFCKQICVHGFDLSTRYIMSIIVSNCQHCDEQQFQTMSCTLHDFLSSKIRFIHTTIVPGSHSCSGKNYADASRTSCLFMSLLSRKR